FNKNYSHFSLKQMKKNVKPWNMQSMLLYASKQNKMGHILEGFCKRIDESLTIKRMRLPFPIRNLFRTHLKSFMEELRQHYLILQWAQLYTMCSRRIRQP